MKQINNRIIELYKQGIAGFKIAKELSLTNHKVYSLLRSKGITRTNKENYALDFIDDYFEKIDTEEKAYFLGLMASDGCVLKPKQSSSVVKLELKSLDSELVLKFSKALGLPEERIKNYSYGPNKGEESTRLLVPSDKLAFDLNKFGIKPKKTFDITYPNISEDLDNHFIRGYFDGDGCITTGPTIKIVGTIDFLIMVQNKLIQNCSVGKTKLQQRHLSRENNIRSLEIGGRLQVSRVYHFLYTNSTICLERKKNRFMELLNENRK